MCVQKLLLFIIKMFIGLLKTLTGATKMVLIVRTDLKMNQGKIASQCAHAAVTLYDAALKSNKDNSVLNRWMQWGQPKVVLKVSVDAENQLRKMYGSAKNNGLNACLIYDAGKTQIQSGTLTVLGIGPNLAEDIDKITCNLKLL